MATKHIIIRVCSECPNIEHGGGFGAVAYIPMCGKKNRELLYTVSGSQKGRCTARGVDVIPDWCPLEDVK